MKIILSITSALVASSLILSAQIAPSRAPLPNFDQRKMAAAVADATPAQAAEAAGLQKIVPGLNVELEPVSGSPKVLSSTESFLTGPDGSGAAIGAGRLAAFTVTDSNRVTKAFLDSHRALFGHGSEALDAARVTRDDLTAHNGMHTMVWNQQVDGIEVFEAKLISHTTRKGELISISSAFIANPNAAATKGTPARASLVNSPAVSARQAVAFAAQNVGETVQPIDIQSGEAATGAEKKQTFTAAVLKGDADAKLIWLPTGNDSMRLCWDVTLMSKTRSEMFRLLVDAESGEVWLRRCLTSYLQDITFNVWTNDSPSPFSPGWPTPNTGQPAVIARSLVTLPAMNTNASPLGWIGDGGNETVGNNVDAHSDRDNNNSPDLPRPQGSPSRVFNPTINLAQDPTNYTAGAIVQLFYLCNWYHDKLYELGFTESAGNFQSNNFARGGFGNDAVQADAQDGSGTDNANFSTPSDGSAGRMQMYVFTGSSPRRDGDFDADVVFHEHTHGLSWRLVGGGQALGDTQSDGMGEGWSDFYALALLSQNGDDESGCYATGGYVTYLLGGLTQNYYFGIRRYPYSVDMNKNPLTFKDIDPAQASSHAGVSRSPIINNTANEVHNEGEVWCMTLREARYNLIQKYGWAVGNQLILQLATDGMKLTVAHPNFLQARNGIIQADQVNNGGANYTNLWAAFAKRGMGASATSPASSTTTGVHEAFDMPDVLRVTPSGGVASAGPVGGPFSVTSTNFTVTNTGPTSLNWSLGNAATWLTASPTSGTLAAGAGTTVNVSLNGNANTLPLGTYIANLQFTNLASGNVPSGQFTLSVVTANDICSGATIITGTSYTSTQSTVTATSTGDPTPSCASFGKGVWFSYTPASSGTMVVDTIGSSFDTVLATYSGSCGALTQIGCNDDISVSVLQSRVTNILTGGVTYHILAGGWSGASGNLVFHLTFSGAGPTAPTITTQPVDQTVNVGGTAAFAVTASGTAPLNFQWRFNSTNLPGATSSNLVLNNVQLNQAGPYRVVVANASGSVTSSVAQLTVNAAGNCTPPPAGLVSWWQGEANLNDFYGFNNGSAVGSISYVGGEVNQSILFNGSSYVTIPASTNLDIGAHGTGITIEGWIKPGGGGVGMPIVEWVSGTGNGGLQVWCESGFRLFGNVVDTSNISHVLITGAGALSSNVFQHVALTYDKSSGLAVLYLNGTQMAVQNFGTLTPLTSAGLNLGFRTGTSEKYTGLLDELGIYNRSLTANEITAIYLAGSAGKCTVQTCTPPPMGLVSWWPGEGSAGDIYGTNNGSLSPTGASYAAGKVGQGFRFDGTNGYVQVADADSLKPANVTLEAWVWLDPAVSPNHPEQVIFKKNTMNAFFEGYSLVVVPPGGGTAGTNTQYQFQFLISSGGTQVPIYSTTQLQRGVWYHVAATYDGNRETLLVNGVAQATDTPGFPMDFGTRPVFIGSSGEAPPYQSMFAGIIDEPSIYSRALSSNEIAAIYLAGSMGKCLPGGCEPAPSGLVGWWKGDGSAVDLVAGNNGTLVNAGYTNGVVGQAFSFDPENLPFGTYSGVQIPDSPAYVLTNALTLEGWVRPRGDGYQIFFRGDHRPGIDPYYLSMNGNHDLYFAIGDEVGNYTNVHANLGYDVWTHIAGTLDGGSGMMSLYTNGTLAAQIFTDVRPFGILDSNQSPGIGIGNINDGGNNFPFIGDIDEISLYNRALSQTEIQALMNAGSAGKCPLAPRAPRVAYLRSTDGQPWGLSDNELTLSNVFGGNWQDLRYETADPNSLFTTNTQFIFMEGGQFTAQAMGLFITNNLVAIQNWVANGGNLLVNAAPNQGGDMGLGFGVTLVAPDLNSSVTAANAAHPIFNGPYLPVGTDFGGSYFNHASVTGPGLSPILVGSSDGHFALAEKSWQSGHVIFGGMTMPFYHAPATESSNLLANLLVYVSALTPEPPSTNDVINFDDLPDNDFGYRVSSGYHGLVWSNYYEINSVTAAPGGIHNGMLSPSNVALNGRGAPARIRASGPFHLYSGYFTATKNDNLVLTVVGNGISGVVYSNKYVLSATVPTLLNFDYLTVTNVLFTAAGGTAHPGYAGNSTQFVVDDLTVLVLPGTPPEIDTDPQDLTIGEGDTATFSVGVSGSTPLHYEWWWNGSPVPNSDSPDFSVTNVSFADDGSEFYCVVTNAYGMATSDAAILTVVTGVQPEITSGPLNQWVAAGDTAVFGVGVSGTPPLFFQWQHDGTNLVGATNAIYSFVVTTNDSGFYSVTVTNHFGFASGGAFLTRLVNSSPDDFVLIGSYISLPVAVNGQFVSYNLSQGGRFNPAGTGGTNGTDFWYPGDPLYNYVVAYGGTNTVNGTFQTLTVSNLSSPTVQHARITGTLVPGPVTFTRDVSFAVDDRVVKVVDVVNNGGLSDLPFVATLENTDPDQGADGTPSGSYATANDVVTLGRTNDAVVAVSTNNNLSLLLGSESGMVVPSAIGSENVDAYAMLSVVDPDGAADDISINLAQNYGIVPAGQSRSATWFMVFGVSYNDVTNAYSAAIAPALVLTPLNLTNCVFTFRIDGPGGSAYELQASPSLQPAVWTSLVTNTLPTNGTSILVDSNACVTSKRFYRAKFSAGP